MQELLSKVKNIGIKNIVLIVAAVVMAVTGWVAQFVMKHDKKEGEN